MPTVAGSGTGAQASKERTAKDAATGATAVATAAAPAQAAAASADKSAVASREAIRQRLTFESLDRDNDGVISIAEAAVDPEAVRLFKERDKDFDYRVTRAEWEAGERGAKAATTAQTPKK